MDVVGKADVDEATRTALAELALGDPELLGEGLALRAELQAFVSAVCSGREPAVTGEEGVAGLEIAIRCLQEKAAAPRAARPSPLRVTG